MSRTPWPATRVLVVGTLVVGTLDALDAILFFGLRSGAKPGRIFQGIAAGLLGSSSMQGGAPTVALGVALHYFVAFGIVTTYFIASAAFRTLAARPLLWGPLYGVAVYFFMNRIVIPLSAIGAAPRPVWPVLLNGLLIHIFGIGIPAALAVARGVRRSSTRFG